MLHLVNIKHPTCVHKVFLLDSLTPLLIYILVFPLTARLHVMICTTVSLISTKKLRGFHFCFMVSITCRNNVEYSKEDFSELFANILH